MICPFCKKGARWCENKEVYGKNYGKSWMMWWCKDCDARVGCHNNSKKPLGTMANKELREWRKKAHSVLDPLWKRGGMPRKVLYQKLKKMFGREIHVGEADIATCQEVIKKIVAYQTPIQF